MASASESYAVAAQLMLRSNVPEALSAIIEGFEKMDRAIRTTIEGFDNMASAARKAADSVARSQTNAADRGARAQVSAAENAARAQQRAAEQTARAQERAADAAARRMARDRDMAERMDFDRDARLRRQAAAAAARGGSHLSTMDVNMAAQETSSVLRGLVTSAGRAALDPAYTLDMLRRDDRVTAADAKGVDDAAWAATRSAPGTTYAKNLEAAVDLKNVTGSLTDAVKILPQFANLSAVLAIADRKSGGSGDQAFAAAKAMEVLGQLTVEKMNPATGKMEQSIDPEQLPARLEKMAKVAVATMGRVSPTDYLAFAKQARAGGMTLSDEFLYEKLPSMLMVMGGQRAGTAIQSMAQVYQGGRLTQKSLREMAELGLAGNAHVVTSGKGKNKHSDIVGKTYEQDLMATDPAAWAAKVRDYLINDRHMSGDDALKFVQKFNQRGTVAGLLADLMKDGAGIIKEQGNIQHTQTAGIAEENPEGKINALHASFENLMAALGGPLVGPATQIMDNVTAALNRAGDWAKANPNEAKILGEVAVGLFGLAAAVAAISGALMIYGPIIAAARGLAAGAPAAAAAGGSAAAEGGLLGAVGWLAKKAFLPIAGGIAVHEMDKDDGIGTWVNAHVPGAASLDHWVHDHTGGLIGQAYEKEPAAPVAPRQSDLVRTQPTGTQDVRITNPGDLARGYQANLGATLSRPPSGPTGFDSTGSVPSHPSTSVP